MYNDCNQGAEYIKQKSQRFLPNNTYKWFFVCDAIRFLNIRILIWQVSNVKQFLSYLFLSTVYSPF